LRARAARTFFWKDEFNSNTFGAPNFFVLNDPWTFLPGGDRPVD
jgi:hypothetical protein